MKDREESVSKLQMEEINLGQIFNMLWNAKWFMFGSMVFFVALVYFLVVVKPIKPDSYSITQTVEIATLQIKSPTIISEPFVLEHSSDVVEILPSLSDSSIVFTVSEPSRPSRRSPKYASDKVILLSIITADKEAALRKVSEAVSLLEARHKRMINNLNDVQVITLTRALNEPKVEFIAFESKLKKYTLFAIVFGGLFGLVGYLLFHALKKRREPLKQ